MSRLSWKTCLALLAAAFAVRAEVAGADFDKPKKPAVDCSQKKNKTKPACQPSHLGLSDVELYNAAYWMNRAGRFAEALQLLGQASDQEDAAVQNETGYALRKLGDVEGALVHYRRALRIDPDYVYARAYMGEALLLQGDGRAARHELDQIARRCGTACPAYGHLKASIDSYRKTVGAG